MDSVITCTHHRVLPSGSAVWWDVECHAFYDDLKVFVGVSVITGVFGALQALCFSLVGRKLAFTIRSTLFNTLIHQDIAFFDGSATGQLTSRIFMETNQVATMLLMLVLSLLLMLLLLLPLLLLLLALTVSILPDGDAGVQFAGHAHELDDPDGRRHGDVLRD